MTKLEKRPKTEADLFQQALDLSGRSPDHSIALAKCLAELHGRDRRELTRFIKVSTIGRRTAYFLLEIGQKLREVRVSKTRLERIGWTKLQIIARHVTRENAG